MKTKSFHHESASVVLVNWGDGRSTLSGLHSNVKRAGHATGLMRKLMQYLDEEGLVVLVEAKAFDTRSGGLTTRQLIGFYEKFGFELIENVKWNLMERVPSQQ